MARVVVFVDGFNVYHALDQELRYHKYKWLDYSQLAKCYVSKRNDPISQVHYFTAYAYWNPEKKKRHQRYIRALEAQGVQTVLGRFFLKDRKCRLCKQWYKTHEEKRTDVNIATYLLRLAYEDDFDKALLISGDSDLVPAVDAVRTTFGKRVHLVIPINQKAEALKHAADAHFKMKESHLRNSQLPDDVEVPVDTIVSRPESWK